MPAGESRGADCRARIRDVCSAPSPCPLPRGGEGESVGELSLFRANLGWKSLFSGFGGFDKIRGRFGGDLPVKKLGLDPAYEYGKCRVKT